jgi:hypothetical protein
MTARGRMRVWLALVLASGCWTGGETPVVVAAPPIAPATPPAQTRFIVRTASGGVIQLEGDRRAAMKQANIDMAGECGVANFVITAEGEEAIEPDGKTKNPTAWRVHYECNPDP